MKKQIFIILFMLVNLSLFSQVALDSADFPVPGRTRYRVVDTLPSPTLNILPGGGANLSWNFVGDINLDKFDTVNFVDPSTTTLPYSQFYPTSNFAAQILPENTVIYLINSSNSHEWLGIANPIFPVPFFPTRDFLEFPINFGNKDTSTYGNTVVLPFDQFGGGADSTRIKNITTEFFEVDAWGTFTDIESNNINSLRRSHLTISVDSIWTYTAGVATFVIEIVDTTQGFSWFGENTGVLANVDVNTNGDVIYAEFIRDSHPIGTGINENIKNEKVIELFPNPSAGKITLDFDGKIEFGTLKIYNTLGSLVREIPIDKDELSIDLSKEAIGQYFYTFQSNESELNQSGTLIINKE